MPLMLIKKLYSTNWPIGRKSHRHLLGVLATFTIHAGIIHSRGIAMVMMDTKQVLLACNQSLQADQEPLQ